ncbi:hypothetical protein KJ951_01460 [Patescibacteria group bacterium]|nr:hypothetical protein [Patescibacteria group bacterium]MBU1703048.1 hypothetical protein [Patescibacteria group bacterium]MBU1953997.1 hypothetical protein [Patescibacteria group bacterium]
MATSKKRINISLPDEVDVALKKLAARDNVPQATEAIHLIKIALEIDEDEVWNDLASRRDKKGAKFISHKDAWA